jgi:hypothetical protein
MLVTTAKALLSVAALFVPGARRSRTLAKSVTYSLVSYEGGLGARILLWDSRMLLSSRTFPSLIVDHVDDF